MRLKDIKKTLKNLTKDLGAAVIIYGKR